MDFSPLVIISCFFRLGHLFCIRFMSRKGKCMNQQNVPFHQGRNEKWKIFSNKYSTEGKVAIIYKRIVPKPIYYVVTEDIFHEEVMSYFLDRRRKGLHFIATEDHGKSSYITNFICTSVLAENYALCNKLIFYHRCSLDDKDSRDIFLFVKRFSETIISLYPGVGQAIYFNQTYQMYLQREYCLLDIFECTKNLILEPLQIIAKEQPGRKHIILIDFLDECLLLEKIVTIKGILRTLIKYLPEQFIFLFISRKKDPKYKLKDLNILSLDGLVKIPAGRKSREICVQGLSCTEDQDFIGYCSDATQTVLQIFILSSARYVQFSRNPDVILFHVVFCCFYVQTFVTMGPVLTSVFLFYLWYLSFKPLQNPTKVASKRILMHKDWFYKLKLRCNNEDVNCIVDRRLEEQYASLKSIYGRQQHKDYEESKTNVEKNLDNLKDMSEFETIYTLNQDKRETREDDELNLLLLNASKKKQPCLCRLLLFRLKNIRTNRNIHEALTIALRNDDILTTRVLSWCITNIFYKMYQEKLSKATHIYPGVRCECKDQSAIHRYFCSKSLVIVVVQQQKKDRYLPIKFRGFQIEFVSPNVSSQSEGKTILEYLARNHSESFYLEVCISNEEAEALFLKHNNLGLICPSIGKSSSFSSDDHVISNELCIQLHCTMKGVIPIGNEHFPNIINGLPTDVIEAQPELLLNLRIGDKVGSLTSSGTLGGFVRYLDVFDCFLTCAHVMYDLKTLLESSSNFARLEGAKAYLHTQQGPVECGHVIWRAFDHSNTSRTSVDAALVVLSNATLDPKDILSCSQNPCIFTNLGLSTPFLNSSCLDHEEFCIPSHTAETVSPGAGDKSKLEGKITFPRQSDVDVQFSNTGPTAASVNANVYHPLWMYTAAHLQLPSGYLTDRRIFRMYNQMALNLPLVQGDSGTCIYIVNHPGNKNGCIGMAIAFCGGLTLVTPLKEIFKKMNA